MAFTNPETICILDTSLQTQLDDLAKTQQLMKSLISPIATLLVILTALTDIGILLYFLSVPLQTLRNRILTTIAPTLEYLLSSLPLPQRAEVYFTRDCPIHSLSSLLVAENFMYPQVLLLDGYFKNDKHIADYSIGMSSVGFIIALYHYYIQLGGKTFNLRAGRIFCFVYPAVYYGIWVYHNPHDVSYCFCCDTSPHADFKTHG